MYLILCLNQSDSFCGGDFIFCNNKENVYKELKYIPKNEVFYIYNLKGKKDIKRYFI